jgi:hypothetical protein
MDAIAYQKKYLIQWQETHSVQINQASALLAFTPAAAFGAYKVSLSVVRLYCSPSLAFIIIATIRPSKVDNTCPVVPGRHLQPEHTSHGAFATPGYVRRPCFTEVTVLLRSRIPQRRLSHMRP